MLIKNVEINNFKSIGEKNNILDFNQNMIAIIGKNETGKSNVLEAIGTLPQCNKPNNDYFKNKNLNHRNETLVTVRMDYSEQENRYSKEETIFTYSSSKSTPLMEGGLSEEFANDNELKKLVENVIALNQNRKIWKTDSNLRAIQSNIDFYLKNYYKIIPLNLKKNFESLVKLIRDDYPDKKIVIQQINDFVNYVETYYIRIPKFFYRRSEEQLNSSYELNEIKKFLNKEDNIIQRLIEASGITKAEFLDGFTSTVETEKVAIRDHCEVAINTFMDSQFLKFYSQEDIKFKTRINDNGIQFSITSNAGKAILIEERSNGMRWCISLFIDMAVSGYSKGPVVFLLDEPGVYLHVNAQKEILKLFRSLTLLGHQLVYTTHLPSMIDGTDITNVKAITKSENGDTWIYKNAYDQRLSKESEMETLSPLIRAIGADMNTNLTPSSNKLNIITEGITDYMYLKAILKEINLNEEPYIIPSTGVSNVDKLVSVLIGWGCNFAVLLDYDSAGKREYKELISKFGNSYEDSIVFVNGDRAPASKISRAEERTIESYISNKDYDNLTTKLIDKQGNKTMVAKEYYDKANSGKMKIDRETIEHFKMLFERLGAF